MNRKRMKILFLCNRIPFPVKDGQSRRTYNILKGLARSNEIFLLSLYQRADDIDSSIIAHLKSFCARIEYYQIPSKAISLPMISRVLRSLGSRYPYTVWRHYSEDFKKRVSEIVKMYRIDITHCDILPLAYAIENIGNGLITLTDHDVCFLKAQRIGKQTPNMLIKTFLLLESIKLKRMEARIFEKVDLGVVVSEHDREKLLELGSLDNRKLIVVENGVDTEEFRPKNAENLSKALIWVGGFDYFPNREAVQFILKKIFPLIKREIPDVTLELVGGEVPDIIKRIANRDKNIRLLGFVPSPVPYLQNANIFISPILSGSGTRLKTLEAMAVGKPIVSTKIGCEGIDGINGVHYMLDDKEEGFAQKVITLLRNPAIGKELGENARKLVLEKYDWKIVNEKINKAYSQLMQTCFQGKI